MAFSFSFALCSLPVDKQAPFLARFTELVSEYQTLTAPVVWSPPAESLPMPTFPTAAPAAAGPSGDGDAAPAAAAPAAAEEKPLAKMTNQELRDLLADLTGKPRGKSINRNFTNKAALIGEITRLRGATVDAPVAAAAAAAAPAPACSCGICRNFAAEDAVTAAALRRVCPQFPQQPFEVAAAAVDARVAAPAVAAPAAAEDTGSETSSKKERRWRWAAMTPEEIAIKKAEIVARLKAGKEKKKAAREAAAAPAAAAAPSPAAGLARLSAQANAIQSSFLSAVGEAQALFEASNDKNGRAWDDLSPEEKNTYIVRVWTGGVV